MLDNRRLMTTMPDPIIVSVRWHDGYIERFEASEVRGGCALLWLRQTDGDERAIPLIGNVRWYSRSVESHQATP
jgi:hypothetical protein